MNSTLPFPDKISLTENERDLLVRYANITAHNQLFHFALDLNKNWKPVSIPLITPGADAPAAILGQFKRLKPPYAAMEVICFLTARETHPSDYVRILLKEEKSEILNLREWLSPGGMVGDFLVKTTNSDGESISRYTALKDAERIFLLKCSVLAKYYKDVAMEFLVATLTFSILHPSHVPYSERMKMYHYYEPLPISFIFPESWAQKSDNLPPANATSFVFFNPREGKAIGNIAFCAEPGKEKGDLEKLVNIYINQLTQNGITVSPYNLKRLKTEHFSGLWSVNVTGKQKEINLEISIMLVLEKSAVFLVGLVGPSMDADIEAWALNRRAFNILLGSLKIGEKEWQFVS